MDLSNELLRNIMELSALEFEVSEKRELRSQLEDILEHVRSLEELNLEDVEPLVQPLDVRNRFREDSIRRGLDQEEALRNAPFREHAYFKVPRILDLDS